MDFVVGLPWSDGNDAIWVVVDRFTKQHHLITCRSTVDEKDLADLFLQWLFRLHGLPETITSDRGTQFASHFWGRLFIVYKLDAACQLLSTYKQMGRQNDSMQ